MESFFSTNASVASCTVNVGEDVRAVVGVPVILPSRLNVRPSGKASEPLARNHKYVPGPVPPDADNAALYS